MGQTEPEPEPNAEMALSAVTKRTYTDAINALNSLQSNFASIEALKKLGANVNRNELSINEVREFTRRMGYTPSEFNRLNIIHVTGTKGKGSTCAFTESILRQYQPAAITKLGLYTSPHLKSVRERIRINGEPIAKDLFTKYFFEVWDRLSATKSDPELWPSLQPCHEVKPMYFKYMTVLSYHVFLREGVDTAIYEVGVGGTYDSTNIVETPTVTGISALGIDHTFMLGDTIESITDNKTGIFKAGVPAFVSQQREYPQTHQQIEERAKELGASSLQFVPADVPANGDFKLGLSGEFQKENASLAVRLANEHLKSLGLADQVEFDREGRIKSLPRQFIRGLENVNWPGRCQIITGKPENVTWYVDGAHTLESISASSTWFKHCQLELQSQPQPTKRVLFFNQQGRDNYQELLTRLYTVICQEQPQIAFDKVIFTPNITWSTGQYNAELLSKNTSQDAVEKLEIQHNFSALWEKLDGGIAARCVFPDIETAMDHLKSEPSQLSVFVCGSLHLVGGFLVVLDDERD
ncbi:uncharacterized protein LODBEIA_P43730 [Lodderomyces beijingensis]|uniref:Folylpolyglutamate synthase n=1 Tax=Lodderomyces beijingensis TaxID=1775926 RepID=A0ABP0ZPS9_9ASCO